MHPLPTMLNIEIGIAAALLALLAARPGITRSAEGKLLAAVALFALPAVAMVGGYSEHVERTKSTQYCLSCHVMSDYGKSMRVDDPEYLAATHYQNTFVPRDRACYSCHSDYGWSGDTHAKLRAVKHVMKTYFGTVQDTIRIARRYKSHECLKCHLGSRPFEESATHLTGPVPMAEIKSGTTSCLKSGCHDVVHEVHSLDEMVLWDPLAPPDAEAAPAGMPGPVLPAKTDSTGVAPRGGPDD